jgi:hypothetical protein
MAISRSPLRWILVALLAIAFAAAVFAVQPRPFNFDSAGFTVFGRGLLEGHAPYTDLFDHKPPGIYMIGAMAWALDPGSSSVSLQAITAVMIGVAAMACGWLVAEASGQFRAGLATTVVAAGGLSLPVVAAGGGMTETFAAAGLAVSFAAIVGMWKGREGWVWPAVAGAGFAWSMNMSLLAIAPVPALAVLWLSLPIDGAPFPPSRSTWRTWLRRRVLDRRLLAAVVGSAAVTLIFWSPVLASGSLSGAIDAIVHYNSLYQATGTFSIHNWIHGMAQLWPLIPAAAVLVVPVGRRSVLGLELARMRLPLAIALWLVAEVAMLLLGRRLFIHYLSLLMPPAALIFGLALAWLWQERNRTAFKVVGVTLLALTVLGLAWHTRPTPSKAALLGSNAELAAYVRANSSPQDSIFVWGIDPDLYLRSDRDPAGPYFFFLPLTMPGYGGQASATTLSLWQTHPPRLVIVGKSAVTQQNGLEALVGAGDASKPGAPAYDAYLEPLGVFVQAHYDLVATLQGGEVWRYRQ